MDINKLNEMGFVAESDPNYVPPKKTGLEQALDALRKTNPTSSVIPYLEKQIRKHDSNNQSK